MDVARIEQLVAGFTDGADGAALKSQELILDLLRHTPAPLSRAQFAPGHITCTGLVLSPALDRILLVHHRRLQRWLLPGGHVEADDPDPSRAAQREVLEETGAELDPAFEPQLAGLDVHGIPPGRGEPFHQHHDLVFLFRATSDVAVSSPESRAVAWCSAEEFDRYAVPSNVRLAFARIAR
jgi:8-oxo-dGTP pyrophosphatase MutT (NUDIX family)